MINNRSRTSYAQDSLSDRLHKLKTLRVKQESDRNHLLAQRFIFRLGMVVVSVITMVYFLFSTQLTFIEFFVIFASMAGITTLIVHRFQQSIVKRMTISMMAMAFGISALTGLISMTVFLGGTKGFGAGVSLASGIMLAGFAILAIRAREESSGLECEIDVTDKRISNLVVTHFSHAIIRSSVVYELLQELFEHSKGTKVVHIGTEKEGEVAPLVENNIIRENEPGSYSLTETGRQLKPYIEFILNA